MAKMLEIKKTREIYNSIKDLLFKFQYESIDTEKRWIAFDDLLLQLEDWNNNEGLNLHEVIRKLIEIKLSEPMRWKNESKRL